MSITTTLEAIRSHGPCSPSWPNLLKHLGKTAADDEPLSLRVILENNGVADAIWCLRALPESEAWRIRLFAVACAEQVKHLMKDQRSLEALDVARKFALGFACKEELREAREGAYAAADAAAYAADTYAAAAADAADAADAAADAADAAAIYADARKKQRTLFLAYFCAPLPKEHYIEQYKKENLS